MIHMIKKTSLMLIAFLAMGSFSSCSKQETEKKSDWSIRKESKTSSTPRPSSTIEEDISGMKVAGIDNIFVLRRNDGGAFDPQDKDFLRASVPAEINRVVSSDDGKAFIIGSTYIIPDENIATWKSRFKVQNASDRKKN